MADERTPSLLEQLAATQQFIQSGPTPVATIKQQEAAEASQRQSALLRNAAERNRKQQSILNILDEDADVGAIVSGGLVNSDFVRSLAGTAAAGISAIPKAQRSFEEIASEYVPGFREAAENLPNYQAWKRLRDEGIIPALDSFAEEAEASRSVEWAGAAADSMPTGDFFDPSTISMGEHATVGGVLINVLEAIGYMAPQFAGGAATGGSKAAMALGGLIGAAQAGQGAIEDVEATLGQMEHEDLLEVSSAYRDLIAANVDPEEAKNEVILRAKVAKGSTAAAIGGGSAFLMQGLIGKAGGDIVGRVPGVGNNVLARGTAITAGTSLEEGFAEAIEDIASTAAVNLIIGSELNTTENSFGNFVMGAFAGGPIGAPAGFAEATSNIRKARNEKAAGNAAIDPDAPLDQYITPGSENFNPMAVVGAAMKVSDPTQKKEALEKFVDALPEVETKLDRDAKLLRDDRLPKYEKRIATLEEQLKDATTAGDTAQVEELTTTIDRFKQYADLIKSGKNKAEIARLKKQQTELSEAAHMAQDLLSVGKEDASKVTQEALKATDADRPTAIIRAVNAIIRNPSSVRSSDIYKMIAKGGKDISVADSQHLTKVAKTQQAIEKLTDIQSVHTSILKGADGWRGIGYYRNQITEQLQRGNVDQAALNANSLRTFGDHMRQKRDAVNAAKAEFQRTGKPVILVPSSEGYVVSPKGITREMQASGEFLHIGSNAIKAGGLVDMINQESAALSEAWSEAVSTLNRYKSQNPNRATNSTTNNAPQSETGTPATETAQEAQEGSVAPEVGDVPGETQGSGKPDYQAEADNLTYVGLQAAISQIEQEQEKREQLLSSDDNVRQYAEEKGISFGEMKSLLTTNHANNAPRLEAYREAIKTKAKPDTSGISFRSAEATTEPNTPTGAAPVKKSRKDTLDDLVSQGNAVLRDGVYFVTTIHPAFTTLGGTNRGTVWVNQALIRKFISEGKSPIVEYINTEHGGDASRQKQLMLDEMGITLEEFASLFESANATEHAKSVSYFIKEHELSHQKNEDIKAYPRKADGTLDLLNPKAVAIEVRATMDALTADQRALLAEIKSTGNPALTNIGQEQRTEGDRRAEPRSSKERRAAPIVEGVLKTLADLGIDVAALDAAAVEAALTNTIQELVPGEPVDRVTGWLNGTNEGVMENAVKDMQARVANGEVVTITALDFRNLAGVNKEYKNNSAQANKIFRAAMETVRAAINNIAPDAVFDIRSGGDEFFVLSAGKTVEEINAAISAAEQEIQKIAVENGLENLKHTKGAKPGIGLYFGTVNLHPTATDEEVMGHAEVLMSIQKMENELEYNSEYGSDIPSESQTNESEPQESEGGPIDQEIEGESETEPVGDTVADESITEEESEVEEDSDVEVAEEESVSVPNTGALHALEGSAEYAAANPKLTNENYTKLDLVKRFFKLGRRTALNTTADFANNISPELYNERVPRTPEADALIEAFLKVNATWANVINSHLPEVSSRNPDLFYRDLSLFMLGQDGNLDPNVTTAISYAAFGFVSDLAGAPRYLKMKDAMRMVGRNPEARAQRLNNVDYRNVASMQMTRKLAVRELGNTALAALGLSLTADAPQDFRDKLANALGERALNMLIERGYIERFDVKLTPYKGQKGVGDFTRYPLIRIKRDRDGQLFKSAATIRALTKGNSSVLSHLIMGQPDSTKPVWDTDLAEGQTPDQLYDQKVTDSGMSVPQKIISAEKKKAAHPWSVRKDIGSLWAKFSTAGKLAMLGSKEPSSAYVHTNRALNEEARALHHMRDIEATEELLNHPNADAGKLHFVGSTYTNQRSGYVETSSPQTNKAMRGIVGMDAWETTVPTDPTSTTNKLFRVAVAQGMGIKLDELHVPEILSELDALLDNDVVKAALASLKKAPEDFNAQDEANVIAAVNERGEGMSSFDALFSLAQMQLAEGQESFQTRYIAEMDGKTNGPQIALLELGITGTPEENFYTAGGFFTNQFTEYAAYKQSEKGLDLYEQIVAAYVRQTQLLPYTEVEAETVDLLESFMGVPIEEDIDENGNVENTRIKSTGRNLVKSPITEFVFGSALDNAVGSGADLLMDSIYASIEAAVNDSREGIDDAARLENVNLIYAKLSKIIDNVLGKNVRPLSFKTLEEAKAYRLADNRIELIEAAFVETIGKRLKEAMSAKFVTFAKARNDLNAAANLSVSVYKSIHDAARENYIQELMASGDLPSYEGSARSVNPDTGQVVVDPKTKVKMPRVTLSRIQERELDSRMRKIFPAMHTAMSRGGSPMSGISLVEDIRVQQPDGTPAYSTRVEFNPANSKAKRAVSTVESSEIGLPGVRAVINNTHGTDSAISLGVDEAGVPTLNAHDAKWAGIGQLAETVKLLNEGTFNTLTDHSIPTEIVTTLHRVLAGANRNRGELERFVPNLDEVVAASLRNAGAEIYARKNRVPVAKVDASSSIAEIISLISNAVSAANTANNNKLNVLAQVSTVAQYPFPGLNPAISNEQRAAAIKRKDSAAKHMNKLSTELDAALRAFGVAQSEDVSTTVDTVPVNTEPSDVAMAQAIDRAISTLRSSIIAETDNALASKASASLERIERLQQVFTAKGSLATALATVYPGKGNAATRERLAQKLKERALSEEGTANLATESIGHEAVGILIAAHALEDISDAARNAIKPLLGKEFTGTLGSALVGVDSAVQTELEGVFRRLYVAGRETDLGYLGAPAYPVNQHLDRAFKKGPISGTAMIAALSKAIDRRTTLGKYQAQVLEMVAQSLKRSPTEVTVGLIDAGNPNPLLPIDADEVRGVAGKVIPDAKGNMTVLLKGAAFEQHGLNTETALHEMVHVATIRQIALVLGGVLGASTEAAAAVDDLNAVLKAARDKVNSLESVPHSVYAAVSSLEELVAYGLTNPEVQNFLSDIQVDGAKTKNRWVSALKGLFAAVSKLLTGRRDTAPTETALGIVLGASSVLMEADIPLNQKYQLESYNQTIPDPLGNVANQSALEVFNELGDLRGGSAGTHTAALRRVMETLVTKVHGAAGVSSVTRNYQADSDYLLNLVNETGMPESPIHANFRMSLQEQMVADQVYAVMGEVMNNHFPIVRELHNILRQVRDTVTPQDFYDGAWERATQNEKDNATAQYNSLIGIDVRDRNQVASFFSLALGSGKVASVLSRKAAGETARPGTKNIGQWLTYLFEKAVNLLTGKLLSTDRSADFDTRIRSLAQKLGQEETRMRMRLAKTKGSLRVSLERGAEAASAKVKDKLAEVGQSDALKNGGTLASLAGNLLTLSAKGRVDEMFNVMHDMATEMTEGKENIAVGILNEMTGTNDSNKVAVDLFNGTKQLEVVRQSIAVAGESLLMGSFTDGGANLTDADHEAVFRGLLKLDAGVLVGDYSLDQIADLVVDDSYRNSEIQLLEQQLSDIAGNTELHNLYIYRSETLAYFLATGNVGGLEMAFNAKNIAETWGIDFLTVDQQTATAAEPLIDKLVTLLSIGYLDTRIKDNLGQLLAKEVSNDMKGIGAVLKYHNHVKETSRDNLFRDSEGLMVKGYLSEVTDQDNSLAMASSEADAKIMEAKGWRKVAPVRKDASDTDQSQSFLMVIPDGGQVGRVTGSLSMTARRTMGTNANIPRAERAARMRELQRAVNQGTRHSPVLASLQNNYAVPSYDAEGGVKSYRYIMNDFARDNVLNRSHNFAETLGYTQSRIFDKVSSTAQNSTIIRAMKETFDAEYADRPNMFVRVSLNSADPELAELWLQLPEAAKRAAKATFGGDFLVVRKDLMRLHFGSRKKSLSTPFNKDPEFRTPLEAFYVNFLTTIFFGEEDGNKIALRIKQGEDIWQAVVRVVKDIRVIRNAVTLIGNMTSNISLVWVYGMDFPSVLRKHKEGTVAALAWQADSAELAQLQQGMSTGIIPTTGVYQARMQELEQALQVNPLRPLVEAGLFQTIVEDVETGVKENQHLAKLYNAIDANTEWVPELGKDIVRHALVTPSTSLYKALHKATQLSDLISRYALYEHLTKRENERMGHEEAIQEVRDAFVNYDLPSNAWVQYANDMGAVMFTKYYLRIQKVMSKMLNKNAARLGAVLLLDQYTSNLGLITDSFIWNKFSNLTDDGAFAILDAFDETAPLSLGLSLL